MNKLGDVVWGVVLGAILGFIAVKVFETWAILFSQTGPHQGVYLVSLFTTPLWVDATRHPAILTTVVVVLYAMLGALFVLYLHHRAECDRHG